MLACYNQTETLPSIATLRRPLFCEFLLLCPQPDSCLGLPRIAISLSRLRRIITILQYFLNQECKIGLLYQRYNW